MRSVSAGSYRPSGPTGSRQTEPLDGTESSAALRYANYRINCLVSDTVVQSNEHSSKDS